MLTEPNSDGTIQVDSLVNTLSRTNAVSWQKSINVGYLNFVYQKYVAMLVICCALGM